MVAICKKKPHAIERRDAYSNKYNTTKEFHKKG